MAKKEKDIEKQPQYYTSKINTQVLNYNVYEMNAKEKLLYSVLLIVVGGVVGYIFYADLFKKDGELTIFSHISNVVIFVGVGFIARKIFLPIINESLRKKRQKKLRLEFRDFLQNLSNSLSSGMNITTAIENSYADMRTQYSENSYMVQEILEILNGVKNNFSVEELLADLGVRSGVEDVQNFAVMFETAYRTGGNLKEIVRRTTDIISEKIMIEEEINTKITSNKMQMMVMNVIPVVLMIMLRVASAEFAAAFGTVVGVVSVTIGAVFFILAYKMGQKIMDIKG